MYNKQIIFVSIYVGVGMADIDVGTVEKVRQLLEKQEVRALFDYLSEFKNNRRYTVVDVVAKKAMCSPFVIRGVFKDLQDLGLGRLLIGRKGHQTRFEWSAPLTAVAEIAAGGQVNDEALFDKSWIEALPEESKDADIDGGEDEAGLDQSEKKTHKYHLRANFEAILTLPSDLTSKDVDKLHAFLNSLIL